MSCSNSYCPKCDKCNNCKECQQNWEECKDCKKCRQLQKPCGHNSMFPYVQQTQLNGIEFSINQNPPYGDKTPMYKLGPQGGKCYPPYYPYLLGYSGLSDYGNNNKQKGPLYPPNCTISKGYYVYHPWYALNGGAY